MYVPSGYSGQSLPVVIMLHGCTQNPDDFAAGTRMNEVAEEQAFLVAYPRQPQSANMQKCWNCRPALPPATRSPGTPPLARHDWRDIPAKVEALRQFWMPIRFNPGA